MLAGTRKPYSTASVGRVTEAEGVALLMFGQAVVAPGSRVGVANKDGCLNRGPPRLDGGGQGALDQRGAAAALDLGREANGADRHRRTRCVPSVAHGTQRVSKKDSVSDVSPDSTR